MAFKNKTFQALFSCISIFWIKFEHIFYKINNLMVKIRKFSFKRGNFLNLLLDFIQVSNRHWWETFRIAQFLRTENVQNFYKLILRTDYNFSWFFISFNSWWKRIARVSFEKNSFWSLLISRILIEQNFCKNTSKTPDVNFLVIYRRI